MPICVQNPKGLSAGVADSSLSSSQTSDRNAEGRAGNVGQANVVAELNRSRVAAVLAADTEFDVGSGGLAQFASHLDQFANADLVELSKGG